MKPDRTLHYILFAITTGAITTVCAAIDSSSCDCPPSKFETGRYYSQFYEDYALAYVFKDYKTGFYIDVGANDPNSANVTRYFYERGWRGINIEPNAVKFAEIVKFRPNDSNFNCGISDKPGTLPFFRVTGSGGDGASTFDRKIAERNKKALGINFEEISVPLVTLDHLLAPLSLPPISFVSIDVEGYEKNVLEGFTLEKYKPAVFCIEATEPFLETPSYMAWEPRLLKNHYVFAMFDGLNRYYVRRDWCDRLLPRFIDIDRCIKMSKVKRKVRLDGRKPWE